MTSPEFPSHEPEESQEQKKETLIPSELEICKLKKEYKQASDFVFTEGKYAFRVQKKTTLG
ncbi:hypothetical protein KKC60_01970 [Patescibacteria group bacterium]|nr:hypothetical protein [Patescibacteria group bacterium]